MRISRALIVALALMVSPVAAAACEVVCGMAPHAAHQVEPVQAAPDDEHAHHGHHPAPASESAIVRTATAADLSISLPAPECDLRGAAPARVRPTSTDVLASTAAITASIYRLDHHAARHVLAGAATFSPPSPPPLTPLPLRI